MLYVPWFFWIYFYCLFPRKCRIMFSYLIERSFSIVDRKTKKIVAVSRNIKTGGKREKFKMWGNSVMEIKGRTKHSKTGKSDFSVQPWRSLTLESFNILELGSSAVVKAWWLPATVRGGHTQSLRAWEEGVECGWMAESASKGSFSPGVRTCLEQHGNGFAWSYQSLSPDIKYV